MKLFLKTIFRGPSYTIGKLSIDGVYFCDTLEDPIRDLNNDGDLDDPGETKIYGNTAIPRGTYKIILALSPRFKRLLPVLLNVKHFTGILMHRGNSPQDTAGCILVGKNKVVGGLVDSTITEEKLMTLLTRANNAGEEITITIE